MKPLLSIAVALAVAVLGVSVGILAAEDTAAKMTRVARWAGYSGALSYQENDTGDFSGYFNVDYADGNQTIALDLPREMPEAWKLYILLHEIGHARQFEKYGVMMFFMERRELELGADYFAVSAMCALRVPTSEWVALWTWFRDTYHYEGDSTHGTLAERIEQGTMQSCGTRSESPFWTRA